MTTTTFDTHEVYQHIKDTGLPEHQAKGIYEAIKIAHSSSELATKRDAKELDYKIELVRRDIKELEQRVIIKIGALIFGFFVTGAGFVAWLFEIHGKVSP